MTDAQTALAAAEAAAASVTTTAANVTLATQQADRAEDAQAASQAARAQAEAAAETAAADAVAAVGPVNDTVMTSVDADAGSAYRVQADARLEATIDTAKRTPTQPLVGSQSIIDSLASAPLTGWTVGTPVTGLSEPDTAAAVTAFNALSGGAYVAADLTRTQPNYAASRKDPVFRITGAFKYNADSSAQTAGTWIAGRTDALPNGGTTGNQGQVSFTLPAGSRYFLMRYRAVGAGATVMKARFWAAKDGGTPKPFRALSNQDGNENITLSADGLYALLPVDLGATGEWTITIDFATATFGGIYTLAALAPIAPKVRAGRALFIADSFGTPGQGQFSTSLGYIMRVVRELGMEAHVSAQGGTGVVARNGAVGVGTSYNYLERVTQVGGDVDGFFDDNDQAAYVGVQLSQNDDTFGWAGTAEFDANFAALCRALRGRFPDVPIDVYGIMHTRERTDASGSAGFATKQEGFEALEDAAMAFLDANPDLNIGYVPGLLRAGIATGTGYLGNPNGTGTSDTATWTDSSHASPINGTAPTGHGQIATQVLDVTTALRPQILQPDGGYKRPLKLTPTIGPAYADQAASGNHTHPDAVSAATARAASAPYRMLRDLGTLNLTGLTAGSYVFAPGVGVVAAAAAGSAAGMIQIDDDQQAISGLTTKARMRVNTYCNATAPACTFTVELVLAGALSGAGDPSVALGAALSPAYTATIASPAANSKTAASSGQVTAPATNTFYLVKVTLSADMAAGSNVRMGVLLEANNA